MSYVCREHYAAVTWRGTGCPACDQRHVRRSSRRVLVDDTEPPYRPYPTRGEHQ